jgi:hypothetical protein
VAFLAGASGFMASVTAGLPVNSIWEAVGKWPLTVVLGAVCVTLAYLLVRQSTNFSETTLKLVEGERLATKERNEATSKTVTELAENNAKEIKELIEALIKKNQP